MSSDNHIQRAVIDALHWEPSVTAAHIGVAANSGVVTLTGHVLSYAEKRAAEAAAWDVKGVKAVAEELEVRLPVETRRSDEEIAAAAINRIAWDVSIPRDKARVRVEKGWITLSGEVEWHFQKKAAEQDISRLFGVKGVSNQITIKPRVDVANISDDIVHALHRSWFFDPTTVTVSAEGSKVRLSGSVHSPHDRQLAAVTAWSSPNVTAVENDIAIV